MCLCIVGVKPQNFSIILIMGFYSDSFFGQGGGSRLKSKSEVGGGRRGAREMRLGSKEYLYTIVKMM